MPEQINTDGLTRRPSAGRSFVQGVGVHVRDRELMGNVAAGASAVGIFGGLFTTLIGAPFEATAPFAQQGPCEIGLEVAGASAAPWLAYGAFVGGRAVVRRIKGATAALVETGRQNIESAPGRFLE